MRLGVLGLAALSPAGARALGPTMQGGARVRLRCFLRHVCIEGGQVTFWCVRSGLAFILLLPCTEAVNLACMCLAAMAYLCPVCPQACCASRAASSLAWRAWC